MNAEPKDFSIEDILRLSKESVLQVNPEYQRGEKWSSDQQKRLIDSIMRGYPLPIFYLHKIEKGIGDYRSVVLEIIDGQQRIKAIHDFAEGAFELFDPVLDARQARFPNYILNEHCDWARRKFDDLSDELRDRFLDTKLTVFEIETTNPHQARDLFIRLQAGTPLSNQEKRDAWPGSLNEFILKTAGKPGVARYAGHEFFEKVLKAKGDRAQLRQFCAQWLCLFLHRSGTVPHGFCDINAQALDDMYYQNLDFNLDSTEAKRFHDILRRLTLAFGDGKRPKMKGFEVLHLILFVDSLIADYTPVWESEITRAYDSFMLEYVRAKRDRYGAPNAFWTKFGSLARTGSDKAEAIAIRHEFFASEMLKRMPNTKAKDPQRGFTGLEREIVYYRDSKKCAVCECPVLWDDAEVHHLEEHSLGGRTDLENAVLVHRVCHPRGAAAAEFAKRHREAPIGDFNVQLASALVEEDEEDEDLARS
jgi:hypothetical protein